MKKEKFYEIFGDIDENSVKAAEEFPAVKRKIHWVRYGTAAAACIAVLVGVGVLYMNSGDDISTDISPDISLSTIETYTSPSVSTESFTAPPADTSATTTPSAETSATTTPPRETSLTTAPPTETSLTTVLPTETSATTVPPRETSATTVPPRETSATTVPSRETSATTTLPTETSATTAPPTETTVTTPVPVETTTAAEYPPLTLENYISDDNCAALAQAVYPEWPRYGSVMYYNFRDKFRSLPKNYKDGYKKFFTDSSRIFLADAGTKNKIYSPISLYLALGMTAEITDGNSRQQILDVLSEKNIDSMRISARSIWEHSFIDDGMAKCVLATSLWTNNQLSYDQDTIDRLADNYYSSVYTGNPASYEYNKLLQDWINEQTDGMLEDQISGNIMDPETVFTIASTVCFEGKWYNKFSSDLTKPDIFHAPEGDIKCDFMHNELTDSYYWGDKFSSISMRMENNGSMRIILPDEGVSPAQLLNDEEVIDFMLNNGLWEYENRKYLKINLSLPKFDVSSNIDLSVGLEKMGITDAFDIYDSDFTPLTEETDVFLSAVKQSTRVMIDEKGCKASSLTIMVGDGAAAPPDEYVDFTVDRPFIFEIVSSEGIPLFVGIVNQP